MSTTSQKDQTYIQLAREIAVRSPCHSQHGCVLVRNGKIVSQEFNHFVVKIGNSRPLTNSAPCLKCTEILKASGQIKRIVFSNDEGEIISFRMRDYESSYVTLGDRYRDWVLI
jgi:deoxycytidylate deaminase